MTDMKQKSREKHYVTNRKTQKLIFEGKLESAEDDDRYETEVKGKTLQPTE